MLRFEELPKLNSKRWFSLERLPDEVWKDVPKYEGILRASNYGRIMKLSRPHSINKIILKQVPLGKYLAVCMTINNKQVKLYVHRIIACTFIDNPNNKDCIDHIDTNKENNTVYNLQWVTYKENINNPITKRFREQLMNKQIAKLDKNGNILCTYKSLTEAALDTGLKKCSISNAAHRRLMPNKYGQVFQCKTAGGYRWQYI